jgi:uncharacterized protein (TIGR03435 family)
MFLKTVAAALFSFSFAMAQAPPAPKDAAPAKQLAFDVVSIRQNQSAPNRNGLPVFGPTADGYRIINMPLAIAIITAYEPQAGNGALFDPDTLVGLPDWAKQTRFDLVAKVAEEDLTDWQNPAKQPAMLRDMLQSLLVDRCKLAVHRDMKDTSVYLLVVGKNGPKFKESNPADPVPPGITLPGGAVMAQSGNAMKMYGATMGILTTMLSSMGNLGRPIQDKTGLTGRYDIVIQPPDMGPPPGGPGGPGEGASAPPDRTSMVMSVVEGLGLKLESSKGESETLVIDHIEKPSEN